MPDTKRSEAGANYRRFVGERWFTIGLGEFLKSDELQLDLRSSAGGGVGHYFVQNGRWEFSLIGGALWTRENYMQLGTLIGVLPTTGVVVTPIRNSGEALSALELSAFNIGDIEIYAKFSVLPSLTESGWVRLNFSNDFKWDLPKDLYFSVGFTDNYDSEPIADAPKNDYIFSTSVGWEY